MNRKLRKKSLSTGNAEAFSVVMGTTVFSCKVQFFFAMILSHIWILYTSFCVRIIRK